MVARKGHRGSLAWNMLPASGEKTPCLPSCPASPLDRIRGGQGDPGHGSESCRPLCSFPGQPLSLQKATFLKHSGCPTSQVSLNCSPHTPLPRPSPREPLSMEVLFRSPHSSCRGNVACPPVTRPPFPPSFSVRSQRVGRTGGKGTPKVPLAPLNS